MDLSTRAIAIAYPALGGGLGYDYDLLPDAGRDTRRRCLNLADAFQTYLDCTNNIEGLWPDLIAIEEPNYPRNAVTQRALVTIKAYIELLAHREHIPTTLVNNRQWKWHLVPNMRVAVKGQGRQAEKDLARQAVLARFPSVPAGVEQDIIDAIGVALYAEDTMNNPSTPAVPKRRKAKAS
jgi:Holliday junction resolvasome RuvABC endonuclease subunit